MMRSFCYRPFERFEPRCLAGVSRGFLGLALAVLCMD
jgi:hypothetical protein